MTTTMMMVILMVMMMMMMMMMAVLRMTMLIIPTDDDQSIWVDQFALKVGDYDGNSERFWLQHSKIGDWLLVGWKLTNVPWQNSGWKNIFFLKWRHFKGRVRFLGMEFFQAFRTFNENQTTCWRKRPPRCWLTQGMLKCFGCFVKQNKVANGQLVPRWAVETVCGSYP